MVRHRRIDLAELETLSANAGAIQGGECRSATVVGWREWVSLPELGIGHLDAKIDTGARTSVLGASSIETFRRQGDEWLRFRVCEESDLSRVGREVTALLKGYRRIRSSNGQTSTRPVIETAMQIGLYRWRIELTLCDRGAMGFRLLLGRTAIGRRFLVDASSCYLASRIG